MSMLCVSILLILASLTTTSWITNNSIEGSLTRCYNCEKVN